LRFIKDAIVLLVQEDMNAITRFIQSVVKMKTLSNL
jgi:hypothetical protein